MMKVLKIFEPLGTYEWAHAITQKVLTLWIESPFDEKKLLRIELVNISLKDRPVKFDRTRFKNGWEFMKTKEFENSYVEKFPAQLIIDEKKKTAIPCKVEITPYLKVDIGKISIAESNIKYLQRLREWWKKPEVRNLSKPAVLATLTRMQPVMCKDGKYFAMKMSAILKKPSEVGFTWNPTPTVERSDLKVLKVIMTHHSDPMPPMFRPDVVEVINQIPKEDFKNCFAFMTDPETAKQGGRYDWLAETTLFTI